MTTEQYDNASCGCITVPVTPPTCNTAVVCDGSGNLTTEQYNDASCGCITVSVTPPTCNTAVVCDGLGNLTTEQYDNASCGCITVPVTPPTCNTTVVCDGTGNLTTEQYDDASCGCITVNVTPPSCDPNCETYDITTCSCEAIVGVTCNTNIVCDGAGNSTTEQYDATTCSCLTISVPPPTCNTNVFCDGLGNLTTEQYDDASCGCITIPVAPPTCNTSVVCDGAGNLTTEQYDDASCGCVTVSVAPPTCDVSIICDGIGNLTTESYNSTTCSCEVVSVTPPICSTAVVCDGLGNLTTEQYDDVSCGCITIPVSPPSCNTAIVCDGAGTLTTEQYDAASCGCMTITLPQPVCDEDVCTNGGTYAWNPNICDCVLDEITINGCTNSMADNYNPNANCDDQSCIIQGINIAITDPCDCANITNVDIDNDGTYDYVVDTITITGPPNQNWTVSASGDALDANGNPLSTGISIIETSSGVYQIAVYYPADGSGFGTLSFMDGNGNTTGITKNDGEGCDCRPVPVCDASGYSADPLDICSSTAFTLGYNSGGACATAVSGLTDVTGDGIDDFFCSGFVALANSGSGTLIDAFDSTTMVSSVDSSVIDDWNNNTGTPYIVGLDFGTFDCNDVCGTGIDFDGLINQTCNPVSIDVVIAPIFLVYDGADGSTILGFSLINEDCPRELVTITVYPNLQVVTNGDATCGTLQADLTTEDGNICDTQSLACMTNGETLNADFSASVIDPLGCANLVATATCANCVCEGMIMGTVTGDVDCNGSIGEPLSGVTIELQDGICTSGVDCPTTITDANGLYEFPNTTCGVYDVFLIDSSLPCPQNGTPINPILGVTIGGDEEIVVENFNYSACVNPNFVECVTIARVCEGNALYATLDQTNNPPMPLEAQASWTFDWYVDGIWSATVVGQPYYSPTVEGNYTVVITDPINCLYWENIAPCESPFPVEDIIDCQDCGK